MDKIRLDENTTVTKTKSGWKLIYPLKDNEGKYIWKNVLYGGSKSNLISMLIIIGLILFLVYSYVHDTQACVDLMENPQEFCNSWFNRLEIEKVPETYDVSDILIPS